MKGFCLSLLFSLYLRHHSFPIQFGCWQSSQRGSHSTPGARNLVHQIIPAASQADLAETATLFREYAATLGVNLDFQNFETEVAGLPGRYAPPDGRLFL